MYDLNINSYSSNVFHGHSGFGVRFIPVVGHTTESFLGGAGEISERLGDVGPSPTPSSAGVPTPAEIAVCDQTYTSNTRFAEGWCTIRGFRERCSQGSRGLNYETCFDEKVGIKRGLGQVTRTVPTGKSAGTWPYNKWLTCIGNPEMKPTSAGFPSVVPPSDKQPCRS